MSAPRRPHSRFRGTSLASTRSNATPLAMTKLRPNNSAREPGSATRVPRMEHCTSSASSTRAAAWHAASGASISIPKRPASRRANPAAYGIEIVSALPWSSVLEWRIAPTRLVKLRRRKSRSPGVAVARRPQDSTRDEVIAGGHPGDCGMDHLVPPTAPYRQHRESKNLVLSNARDEIRIRASLYSSSDD